MKAVQGRGKGSMRPSGTQTMFGMPSQDCASLVLGYFRLVPLGRRSSMKPPTQVDTAEKTMLFCQQKHSCDCAEVRDEPVDGFALVLDFDAEAGGCKWQRIGER